MTPRQTRLLVVMALAVLAMLGFLGWTVWSTLNAPVNTVSLLPTPLPPSPTPTPTRDPFTLTPSPTPPFEMRETGEIAAAVAQARELLPRWETPFNFVSEYELSIILHYRYQTVQPFPVREQRTLQILDLWPEGPVSVDAVAQAKSAAALYLPEEEQLYLRRDWTGSADNLRKLLAYSFARAIPEQHGNLQRLRADAPTLDQRLALDAVAEGDAWFSLTRYVGLAPDDPATAELSALIARAAYPQWRAQDPLVFDLNWLALKMGAHFAAARYAQGGIPALDEALRRPPRSTEQLLYPDRYAADDRPMLVEPVTPPLGRGWQITLTETLGAAMMQVMLETVLPPNSFAVEGWGGDLIQVWEGPDGARLYIWQTVWDSGSAAAVMVSPFKTLLPQRVAATGTSVLPAGLPRGQWWTGRRGGAFFYRTANHIWLIWGDDPDVVKAATSIIP